MAQHKYLHEADLTRQLVLTAAADQINRIQTTQSLALEIITPYFLKQEFMIDGIKAF